MQLRRRARRRRRPGVSGRRGRGAQLRRGRELARRAGGGVACGEIENVVLARNYLHDQTRTALHNLAGCAMYLGWENAHRGKSIRAQALFNLFERSEGKSVIHVKSSDNLIAFNHLRATVSASNFGNRHGRRNACVGNRIEHGHLASDDYDGRVLGNLIVGSGWISALAGNWSAGYTRDTFPAKPQTGISTHPAARNTVFAGPAGGAVPRRSGREPCP